MTEFKNKIVKFVEANSYLEFHQDGLILIFTTRENGSVGDEEYSPRDVMEAKRIGLLVKERFNVNVRIDTVDEWVNLNVFKSKQVVDYNYTFKKDIDGRGFSHSFDSMDELIDKYGQYVDVDWDEIKTKVDEINKFPHDKFTDWFNSTPMLIKKAGAEGNKWGYNFYIIKSKKEGTEYIEF